MITKHMSAAAILAMSAGGALAQTGSLTTAAPNNGQSGAGAGIFFNLTGSHGLVVDGIDYQPSAISGTLTNTRLLMTEGTYVGKDTSALDWLDWDSQANISLGNVTPIDLGLNLPLDVEAGVTRGLYLIADAGGIRYTGTDLAPPDTIWSNSDVTLFSSLARSLPFGGSAFDPRCFSGTVRYHLDGCELVDGFSIFGLGSYTQSGGAANASTGGLAAHDGLVGVSFADDIAPTWYYKNTVTTSAGNIYSAFVRYNGDPGRVYLGVDADAGGTISAVFAPNTSELILQDNTGYTFVNLSTASIAPPVVGVWYRLQLVWGADGAMTARLLNEAGTSVLGITPVVATGRTGSGGVAFRGFNPSGSGDTAYLDTISGCEIDNLCPAMVNAGFQDGLSGWATFLTFNGANASTAIVPFDMDGAGPLPTTDAVRYQVGQAVLGGDPGGVYVNQHRTLTAGRTYQIRANVAAQNISAVANSDGGTFELIGDFGQVLDSVAFGSISAFTTERATLEGEFVSIGSLRTSVGVRIKRGFLPATTNPVYQYVDNVILTCVDGCGCVCDYDTSTGAGVCDFFDFISFQDLFAAGDPCGCDLDTSTGTGVCDFFDFISFQDAFSAGC